mmetsp:Transcript_17762/g.16985  ORF Transcript_17762/g.16985 Transcript_17762/m.16985 type:complete len:170 (+) Transcript_17762:665-1174(+)
MNFSTEYYLHTSKVLQIHEYDIDKFFLLLEGDSDIHILDRKRKKIIDKVSNPSYQKPQGLQFQSLPLPNSPFLLLRDGKNLSVVDIKTKTAYSLLKEVSLTDNAECNASFFVNLGQEVVQPDNFLPVSQDRKAMEDFLGKPGSPEEIKSALNEPPAGKVKRYQLEANLI